MNERGANIDIVFRNGLRDYEALPPPEVWDHIKPLIKRKQRSYILISTAALIAVVFSLSLLAYRWSREVAAGIDSNDMALSGQDASPLIAPSANRALPLATNETSNSNTSSLFSGSDTPLIIDESAGAEINDNHLTFSSAGKFKIASSIENSLREPLLKTLNPVQKNSFEILTADQQYTPDITSAKSPERWSIAAMASPTYYSKFGMGSDDISKQMSSSEQSLISYTGGLALSYKINKRFTVQTGIYYSSIGQQIDGIQSYGGFQPYSNSKGGHNFEVLTTSGAIFTNNSDVFLQANSGSRVITSYNNDVFDPLKANLQPLSNTLHQDFSYLELPVVLKYKIIDKAVAFNLIGGVSYNFLVNNNVYTMVDGSKYQIGTTRGLNSFTLSSSLGMGMEYSFTKNLSLNLEPTFRYYLNPFSGTEGSTIHPYSFGLFSGISYKF
jgi:hypothetical protein